MRIRERRTAESSHESITGCLETGTPLSSRPPLVWRLKHRLLMLMLMLVSLETLKDALEKRRLSCLVG